MVCSNYSAPTSQLVIIRREAKQDVQPSVHYPSRHGTLAHNLINESARGYKLGSETGYSSQICFGWLIWNLALVLIKTYLYK